METAPWFIWASTHNPWFIRPVTNPLYHGCSYTKYVVCSVSRIQSMAVLGAIRYVDLILPWVLQLIHEYFTSQLIKMCSLETCGVTCDSM